MMRQQLVAGKAFAALRLHQSLSNQARIHLALWPEAMHGSTMPTSVRTLRGSMDIASTLN